MSSDSSSIQFGAFLVQHIFRRLSKKTKKRAIKKRLLLLAYQNWKTKSRHRDGKIKRHRRSKPPVNYLTSVWWEMLQDPRIKDPKKCGRGSIRHKLTKGLKNKQCMLIKAFLHKSMFLFTIFFVLLVNCTNCSNTNYPLPLFQ